MAKVTDENDNLIDTDDVEVYIPRRELLEIFNLADRIAQVEVRYESDPLEMANKAIEKMQRDACEIAAIVASYNR